MTETELSRILKSIDDALAIYQAHQGTLKASDISVKSMLMTLRTKIAEELNQEWAFKQS